LKFAFVEEEFRSFLDCGVLARGFLRLHCSSCGHDRLLPFSCKGRVWCPVVWRAAHGGHSGASGGSRDSHRAWFVSASCRSACLEDRVDERSHRRTGYQENQTAEENQHDDDWHQPEFLSLLHEIPKLRKKFSHIQTPIIPIS